ncbi:phosphoribosyltransferase family protein [Georgenia muralis]
MGWFGQSDIFRDRVEAGRLLGERLAAVGGLEGERTVDDDLTPAPALPPDAVRGGRHRPPLVVGLPRGGVPVAAEVARALDAPLDVVVVRKLGVPWQPELAMGAIGEEGVRVLNPAVAARVDPADLDAITRRKQLELDRRVRAWRGVGAGHEVAGRTVVVVDDGIATGATVRAAVAVLLGRGADRIVLAVPVVARDVAAELRGAVDDLVALNEPADLHAVGAWYEDFSPVPDEDVRTLLVASRARRAREREVLVPTEAGPLPATVTLVDDAAGVVLFAHGSGSSRLSPRNRAVAAMLHEVGLSTVLMDLLTEEEGRDRSLVFDIPFLAGRLRTATDWTAGLMALRDLPLGYFGASTGAGAALWAAADHPARLRAVVSRGGRPDLAAPRLGEVEVPTLLVVGGLDTPVLELNRAALEQLRCPGELVVVPGATHLFEEPGTLERAGAAAAAWFRRHLTA